MANKLEKWTPSVALPNLPLSKIEIEYQGGQGDLNLRCHVRSSDGVNLWGQTHIRISGVWSFKLYEEFQDTLQLDDDLAWPEHRIKMPYGGVWPYFEIKDSVWLKRLSERDCRDLKMRHLVVVSLNETLHIATSEDVEVAVAGAQESAT